MTPVEKMVTAHPVMFQITQHHTGSFFIGDKIHTLQRLSTRHTKLRQICHTMHYRLLFKTDLSEFDILN